MPSISRLTQGQRRSRPCLELPDGRIFHARSGRQTPLLDALKQVLGRPLCSDLIRLLILPPLNCLTRVPQKCKGRDMPSVTFPCMYRLTQVDRGLLVLDGICGLQAAEVLAYAWSWLFAARFNLMNRVIHWSGFVAQVSLLFL